MSPLELLTEPVSVQDIYASGLAAIEDLGEGNLRFTFYTKQRSLYGGGDEHVIVSRIIMPTGAVHAGMKATMKALGFACCGAGKIAERH